MIGLMMPLWILPWMVFCGYLELKEWMMPMIADYLYDMDWLFLYSKVND